MVKLPFVIVNVYFGIKMFSIGRIVKVSGNDIAIVCPRGGDGEKNTFDPHKSQDIDENRMLILEQGMDN
jgi:hypothetical protein